MNFTTKIHMTGRLYESDGSSFLAKVPLFFKAVPECPQSVTIGAKVYVLTGTAPLQYTRATSTKATRLNEERV